MQMIDLIANKPYIALPIYAGTSRVSAPNVKALARSWGKNLLFPASD